MKIWLVTLFATFVCASFAAAEDFGGYTFLKISGPDARAVVRTPAGEKQLVAPGDVLGVAKIVEIAANRVVLEQADPGGTAVLIVTVRNGRQQVSRMQQMPVKVQAVSAEQEAAGRQFGQ